MHDSHTPDLAILSSDGVRFYTHKERLQAFPDFVSALTNRSFKLPSDNDVPHISLPETSSVVSIILHVVYGFEEFDFLVPPPLEDVLNAVTALETYGFLPLERYITPSSAFFQLLIHHASLPNACLIPNTQKPTTEKCPALLIYILAAKLNLQDLAVAVSANLLSFPLQTLSDDDAINMGPVYLRRLFQLQLARSSALKALLSAPPCKTSEWFERCGSAKHSCDLSELDKMTRAWALASSYIILNGEPDMDVHTLDSVLRPLGDDITCNGCRRLWSERVYDVVSNYGSLKVRRIHVLPYVVQILNSATSRAANDLSCSPFVRPCLGPRQVLHNFMAMLNKALVENVWCVSRITRHLLLLCISVHTSKALCTLSDFVNLLYNNIRSLTVPDGK
jgi:hypothetical protein